MNAEIIDSEHLEGVALNATEEALEGARSRLVLKNDVLLRRKGRIGEPYFVFLRLPAGTRIPLLLTLDDPEDRTPNLCVYPGWPEFFWVGRGEVESA